MTDRPSDASASPPFEGSDAVGAHWEDVLEDMATTAAGFRDAGWDVLELHPGQVLVREQEGPSRLDALVPDNEYDELVAFVDDGAVDAYDVYEAVPGPVLFLLVLRDETRERAVLLPGYYTLDDGRRLYTTGPDVTVSVRRLQTGEYVTFELEDRDEFFPDAVREVLTDDPDDPTTSL